MSFYGRADKQTCLPPPGGLDTICGGGYKHLPNRGVIAGGVIGSAVGHDRPKDT